MTNDLNNVSVPRSTPELEVLTHSVRQNVHHCQVYESTFEQLVRGSDRIRAELERLQASLQMKDPLGT